MNRGNRHIAIVGAGASGLFLAKKLSAESFEEVIKIIEKIE